MPFATCTSMKRTSFGSDVAEAADIAPIRVLADRPVGLARPPWSGALASPRSHAARAHSGMLSCFFHGLLSRLCRSDAKARATRRRVECGMITSSMKPRSAATKGLAKRAS